MRDVWALAISLRLAFRAPMPQSFPPFLVEEVGTVVGIPLPQHHLMRNLSSFYCLILWLCGKRRWARWPGIISMFILIATAALETVAQWLWVQRGRSTRPKVQRVYALPPSIPMELRS